MAEIIFNAEFVKTEYAGNSCKNIKKQINTDEMVTMSEKKLVIILLMKTKMMTHIR